MTRWISILFLAGLSGCALIDGDDAIEILGAGACNSLSVRAFEETVYPVVRQRCAQCHGAAQNPLFAVDNATSAHAQARPRANFVDTATSVLALKAGDNHCDSGTCNNRQQMLDAIAQWKEKAGDGGSSDSCDEQGILANFTYVTHPQSVAASVPVHDVPAASSTYMTMTWDLGSISEELRGTQVSIDIQRFTARDASNQGSFRMRWPQITAAGYPVKVKGIRVLVDNRALYTTWVSADTVISPMEKARVHLGSLVFLQESDKMPEVRIVFDQVKKVDEPVSCKELAEFEVSVLPALQAGNTNPASGGANCLACHADSSQLGYQFLNLSGTTQEMCDRILQRTDGKNAMDSVFIRATQQGMRFMSSGFAFNTEELDAVKLWIEAERPPESLGLGGLDPDATPEERFRFQVYPIMVNDCNACHNNSEVDAPQWLVGGRTAVMERLLNDNPASSETSFINKANPGISLLLLKPTNTYPAVGHGGGERFSTTSQSYDLFRGWIESLPD